MAWGARDYLKRNREREKEVLSLISCKTLYSLVEGIGNDLTNDGYPRHPLQRDRVLTKRKIFNGAFKK